MIEKTHDKTRGKQRKTRKITKCLTRRLDSPPKDKMLREPNSKKSWELMAERERNIHDSLGIRET